MTAVSQDHEPEVTAAALGVRARALRSELVSQQSETEERTHDLGVSYPRPGGTRPSARPGDAGAGA